MRAEVRRVGEGRGGMKYDDVVEMECCHHVFVTGDENGGVQECHPYVMGTYKKIGVCGGRSLYQHDNNTEIFMYYGCGRWFIGLEVGGEAVFMISLVFQIGVCGGWVFTKTPSICIHGQHEKHWQYVDEVGLRKDRTFGVGQDCDHTSKNNIPRCIFLIKSSIGMM